MKDISLIVEQKAKGIWKIVVSGGIKRLENSLKVLTSKMIFRMRKRKKQIRGRENF